MSKYGSDKPDTRYALFLQDIKEITDRSDFNAFKSAECVKAIIIPDGAKYSRKIIDELTDFVKKYKAKGLAWMKADEGKLTGGIAKFFNNHLQEDLIQTTGLNNGDIIFIIGDEKSVVEPALGALRVELARREGLTDPNDYKPLWVTSFPMFEYNEDEDRFAAMHHPFTAPQQNDIKNWNRTPLRYFQGVMILL